MRFLGLVHKWMDGKDVYVLKPDNINYYIGNKRIISWWLDSLRYPSFGQLGFSSDSYGGKINVFLIIIFKIHQSVNTSKKRNKINHHKNNKPDAETEKRK